MQPEGLRPDVRDRALHRGTRGDVRTAGRAGEVRCRQRAPVQLSAGCARQRRYRHESRRHQVLRQRGAGQVAKLVRRHVAGRHHVGDQAPDTGLVLARDDGGLRDGGMAGQHRLDLARLDAEAPDLHLRVRPAQVLQFSGRQPARHVAGAVHPLAGRPERVGREPLRRQAGTVQVPARELSAGQVQLTGYPYRYRRQVGVEQVRADVRHRAPDDRLRCVADPAPQGVHCALGRAVHVEARRVGDRGQFPPQVGADRLAADHEHPRPVPVAPQQPGREHLAQERRRQVDQIDPVCGHVVRQRPGIQPYRVGDHVQLVPVDQEQQRIQRGVEGERGGQRDPHPAAAGYPGVALPVLVQQVHQRPVRYHHTLRGTGRTGGVDDVRRVVGAQRGSVALLRRRCVHTVDSGQYERRTGVAYQEVDAAVREVGVDGQVRAAGLEYRQDRHHHVRRAGQRERHHPLRPHAGGDQLVRQAAGPRVEFGEGPPDVAAHQRGRVGGTPGLGGEQLRNGGRRYR